MMSDYELIGAAMIMAAVVLSTLILWATVGPEQIARMRDRVKPEPAPEEPEDAVELSPLDQFSVDLIILEMELEWAERMEQGHRNGEQLL
jgi:hypothetical protein